MAALFAMLYILWASASTVEAGVSNVRVEQRSGSQQVDIYYDLSGEADSYDVTLEASRDGGETYDQSAVSLSGDIGPGVHQGSNRHIVWNAGDDWEAESFETARVRLTVEPSRGSGPDVLYWTVNGPEIMSLVSEGTGFVEVFNGIGMAGTAVDVAVTETHIYWTDKNDTSAGGVWRANRDGSDAALFVSNPDPSTIEQWSPQFIVIDEALAEARLYFSCYFTGIYSAKLSDGSDVVHLGAPGGGETHPRTYGIAVRGSNELISVNALEENAIWSTNIATKESRILRFDQRHRLLHRFRRRVVFLQFLEL